MFSSFDHIPSDRENQKLRKMLANSYLREGRWAEALNGYLLVLEGSSEDVEVLLILGNIYLALGSSMTAFCLYQHVLDLEPDNPIAKRQHAAAGNQHGGTCEEIAPTTADAITRLVIRIKASDPLRAHEIRGAADMLENNLPDEPVGTAKAGQVEKNEQLMPALIEMNIREANAAGFLELAGSLRSLQNRLTPQMENQWKAKP